MYKFLSRIRSSSSLTLPIAYREVENMEDQLFGWYFTEDVQN